MDRENCEDYESRRMSEYYKRRRMHEEDKKDKNGDKQQPSREMSEYYQRRRAHENDKDKNEQQSIRLCPRPERSRRNNNNNNTVMVSCEEGSQKVPVCSCGSEELVKNGGFEIPAIIPGQIAADWTAINVNNVSVERGGTNAIAYEGLNSIRFASLSTQAPADKTASLRQTVIVPPGCLLQLTFAENLFARGVVPQATTVVPRLIARVFFVGNGGIKFELINIPIAKIDKGADTNKGFTMHQQAASVPVPCNVSGVIVQFDFSVTDVSLTQWIIDGVSLRAVSSSSVCC